MKGHIERRVSERTGRVSYRVRLYVGKREGGEGWISGGTFARLRAKPGEPSAEAALEDLKASIMRGDEPEPCTDTVAELCERWLRDAVRPDRRANTVRAHEKAMALHITPALGDVLAAELTPADVATWQAALIAAGCAPKSVRNYRGTLHAAYAWAVRLGLLDVNPVSAVPAPRLAERATWAPALAEAQQYITALAETRLYPALLVAALTGMRRGEVLALRWCDVDLANGTARVTRQLTGRNRATLAFGPPKTARGKRTVTLPTALTESLTALRAQRIVDHLPVDDEALICCGRRGQPIVPDGLTHELRRRLQRRGLPRLNYHALRHMVATEMLRAGERMDVVSAHLGHAQVATTLGVYGHVTEDDRAGAAVRLQGAWERAAGANGPQTEPAQPLIDELSARRRLADGS